MSVSTHTVEVRYGANFSSDYFGFEGMPTPYVSRSQEMVYYGTKWCQLTTITLDGQIIGSQETAPHLQKGADLNTIAIKNDREKILSGFRNSFQNLAIYENSTAYKIFNTCAVKDLSFSPSNWGAQDYSITLECFDDDEFLGAFGVLEPQDSVSFTDNEDGTVAISHTISAQGFNANGLEPITNANNFVNSRTGYNVNKVIPEFITGIENENLVITNISRDANRIDATYSTTIDYIVQTGAIGEIPVSGDLTAGEGFVSIIDASVNSGINDDFITVDVNYTLQGDKYCSPTVLRDNFPPTGVLWKIATGAAKIEELATVPLSLSVEDTANTNHAIKVNASFDNNTIFEDLGSDVYFDYNVDVSTDDITDQASVSINGEIKARGNTQDQFALKSGYFPQIKDNLFLLAQRVYTGINYNTLYSNTGWSLNPLATSISYEFDEIGNKITLNASFNNKDWLPAAPDGLAGGFRDFSYSVNVTPPITQYTVKPSCNENGQYGLFDLGTTNREKINLNINSNYPLDYAKSLPPTPPYDYLGAIHDYSNSLRVAMIPSQASDVVIDNESSTSAQTDASIVPLANDFNTTVTQSYNYFNPTTFL